MISRSFSSDKDWQKVSNVQAIKIEDADNPVQDFPSKIWSLERLEKPDFDSKQNL